MASSVKRVLSIVSCILLSVCLMLALTPVMDFEAYAASSSIKIEVKNSSGNVVSTQTVSLGSYTPITGMIANYMAIDDANPNSPNWMVTSTKKYVNLTTILNSVEVEGQTVNDLLYTEGSSVVFTGKNSSGNTAKISMGYSQYLSCAYYYGAANQNGIPADAINTYTVPVVALSSVSSKVNNTNTTVSAAASANKSKLSSAKTTNAPYLLLGFPEQDTSSQTNTFSGCNMSNLWLSQLSKISVTAPAGALPSDPAPEPEPQPQPEPEPSGPTQMVSRLWGTNWDDTMYDIVNTGWGTNGWDQNSTDSVIIANSTTYEDALSASGLAGMLNCPVLMTPKDKNTLDPKAAQAIKSIYKANGNKPINVYIVGGPVVVNNATANSIAAMKEVKTPAKDLQGVQSAKNRFFGMESYDTALEIYKAGLELSKNSNYNSWSGQAIVATSKTYQDALSIASYAYSSNTPVFLTNRAKVFPPNISNYISTQVNNGSIAGAIVVGGQAVVSNDTYAPFGGSKNVKRLWGESAYDTSNQIAEFVSQQDCMNSQYVGVAWGEGFTDALSAGPLCGLIGAPLVLASADDFTCIDSVGIENGQEVANGYILQNSATITNALIFGGTAVLPQNVQTVITEILQEQQ